MQVNKILLVDDDPSIGKIARITLTSAGKYQVTSVSSGADALQAAMSEKFDLVILDVMMPNLDGPMTLAKLRAIPSLVDLPVIFMTANVQKHELDRLQILGARGVITKPFEPLQLCKQIEAILDGSCFFETETVRA